MGLPLHYEDVFGLRTPNRDSFQPFITVPTLTGGCGRTFGLPAVSSTKGSLDSFAGPAAPHSSDGIHLGWWGEAQNPVSLGWVDVGLMCFLVGAFKHVLLHILSPFGMKTTPDWLHIYEMGCAFQLASMVFFHFFFQTSPFQWIGLRQHLQEPRGFIPKFRLPVMAAVGSHSRRTPTAFCGPLGFWAQPPVSTPQVGHEGARLGDVNAEFLWLFFWLAISSLGFIHIITSPYITISCCSCQVQPSARLQVLPAPLGKVPTVVLRQQPSGRAVLLQGGPASF